jgi:hypothetical protein
MASRSNTHISGRLRNYQPLPDNITPLDSGQLSAVWAGDLSALRAAVEVAVGAAQNDTTNQTQTI